jgi:hypothetical protein
MIFEDVALQLDGFGFLGLQLHGVSVAVHGQFLVHKTRHTVDVLRIFLHPGHRHECEGPVLLITDFK